MCIRDRSLDLKSSFEILSQNSQLIDSIIQIAFDYAFEDLPTLKDTINEELKKEYDLKKCAIRSNGKKIFVARKKADENKSNPQNSEKRQLLKYYNTIEADLKKDKERINERIAALKEQIPLIEKSFFNVTKQFKISFSSKKFIFNFLRLNFIFLILF